MRRNGSGSFTSTTTPTSYHNLKKQSSSIKTKNNIKYKPKPARLLNQKNMSTTVLLLEQTSNIQSPSNNGCNDNNNSSIPGQPSSTRSLSSEMSSTTLNIREHTSLFGINLSVFGDLTVGIILLSVVMLGFILIGLVEEGFKFAFPDFSFGWTMTAIELYIFSLFAVIETIIKEATNVVWNNIPNTPNNILPQIIDKNSNITSEKSQESDNLTDGKESGRIEISSDIETDKNKNKRNNYTINSNNHVSHNNTNININNNNNCNNNNNINECKDSVITRKDNNNVDDISSGGMSMIYGQSQEDASDEEDLNSLNDNDEDGAPLLARKSSTNIDINNNNNKLDTIDEDRFKFNDFSNLASDSYMSKKMNMYDKSKLVLYKVFHRRVPLKFHFQIAVAMTASRGLTNISMLLLNYPTQVIFKSMKLISVMIGSQFFFLKKTYLRWDYCAALFMVISAILFTLGDTTDTKLNFNLLGVIVVLFSLIFDSAHSNGQEWVLNHNAQEGMKNTHLELLLYSNFFSAVLATFVAIIYGEISGLMLFLTKHSIFDILAWFFIRVLCLYIGVSAFIVFTKRFGAVYATTATTVRKILTVLLSYVFWPGTKTFTQNHAVGTCLFAFSMLLNWQGVRIKQQKKNSNSGRG